MRCIGRRKTAAFHSIPGIVPVIGGLDMFLLASSVRIKLYEKFGFRAVGSVEMKGDKVHDYIGNTWRNMRDHPITVREIRYCRGAKYHRVSHLIMEAMLCS